jgi:PadR family transcriptional regulator, regulatory protein AphA
MEYVILGLLMIRTRTLYEINKILKTRVALFYSASFGSISSAIGKLLAKGWISVEEQVARGRNKKIYAITPEGADAFATWLGSPIPGEQVKDHALTRLFFLGFLQPPDRVALISSHVAKLEALAADLATLADVAQQKPAPAARHDLARFQRLTLQYGQDYYAFSIAWFKRLLADLKEEVRAHDTTGA